MKADATYAKHTVVANLESLLPASQWAVVDRAFRAGPGLLVRFEARLVPGVARQLERVAALGDPQLATPVEYGVDEDEAWILYAGTLDETLEALSGPLSMGEIAQLGEALVAGLERAHDQGFIHPGITSSLVRMHIGFDGRVHPELLGLGLPSVTARTVQDDLADVAALLYTLYTGRPPFEPGAPRDGAARPKSFTEVRPGGAASASFEAAVMRALGPRAAAFWTAGELRAALALAPMRRTGPSARPSTTTDPNLPRVARREASFAAPLPVSTPVPEAFPALAAEPRADKSPLETAPEPPQRRRFGPLAIVLAFLLVGGGVALGLALGGGGGGAGSSAAGATPMPHDRALERGEPTRAPSHRDAPKVAAAEAPALPHDVAKPEPAKPAAVEPAKPAAVEPAKPAAVEPAKPAAVEPAPVAPPTPTTITITTEPSGALVRVNGSERGRTPLDVVLAPADLPATVVFERHGYVPTERKVETLTGPTMALAVALRAKAKPAPPTTPPANPPAGPILLGR